MREWAYIKEPYAAADGVCKIMIYEASRDEVCLFCYSSRSAVECSGDLLYGSLAEALNEWGDKIAEDGWHVIADPLPDCQWDCVEPIRIKGRDTGKPQWCSYEILRDGQWADYRMNDMEEQ